MNTTKQDLIAARRLIEVPGTWCQHNGHTVTPEGVNQYCLLGAIDRVTDSVHTLANNGAPSRYNAARAVVVAMLGPSGMFPVTWNDLKGRTQAEVLELLDKAIEAAA